MSIRFRAYSPVVNEAESLAESPECYVSRIAHLKWRATAAFDAAAVTVAADTTVVGPDETLLHKPSGRRDAERILRKIRGRTIPVHTGFAIGDETSGQPLIGVCTTWIKFRNFSNTLVEDYVSSGRPLGKAGAFGLQDPESPELVEEVKGCSSSVVGLPICRLNAVLSGLKFSPKESRYECWDPVTCELAVAYASKLLK